MIGPRTDAAAVPAQVACACVGGATENAPSQNQPFLQATPETLPDARSYFGAFAKTHEKKVGTDKHCPTRACWFPKYTPKYETQYLPKKKDGKYEGSFAVGALAFDAQVDLDKMHSRKPLISP